MSSSPQRTTFDIVPLSQFAAAELLRTLEIAIGCPVQLSREFKENASKFVALELRRRYDGSLETEFQAPERGAA